jgi:hypothetical protein
MSNSPPHLVASLPPATSIASEPLPDSTLATNTLQTPHLALAAEGNTALSKFCSFMTNRIRPGSEQSFAGHTRICQESFAAAGATADKSKLATIFNQFDKVWCNTPDHIKKKNRLPDLTNDDYKEYRELIENVDTICDKLKVVAFDPTGRADCSRIAKFWEKQLSVNRMSNDIRYHALFS